MAVGMGPVPRGTTVVGGTTLLSLAPLTYTPTFPALSPMTFAGTSE
ncbi:MAG: hypothetical protein QOJ93_1225 [Actinomycetota bacterium]|nr:hypothetical protein [Actinomycetota bacterium]